MIGAAVVIAAIGALLAAAGLVKRRPRTEAAGAGVLLAAWLLALVAVAPLDGPTQHAMAIVAAVAGTVTAAALVRLAWRWQGWLLALVAAALPVRVEVAVGGESASLLAPFYVALVPAALASIAVSARRSTPAPGSHTASALHGSVLALFSLAALSLLWSSDDAAAATDVALFWMPFALLYLVALQVARFDPSALRVPALCFCAVMTLAALVGLYQQLTRTVWQNPKVITANAFAPTFRTNSFFWDPNVYGRYLACALVLLLAIATWQRLGRRPLIATLGTATIMAVALWYTYSNSSMVALGVGTLVLLVGLLGRGPALALLGGGIVACVAAVPLLLASNLFADEGRTALIRGGVQLATENPLGVGVGAFEQQYGDLQARRADEFPRLRSSHTAPVTIAAELGIAGLGMLVALLGALIAGSVRALRASDQTSRIAIGASLAVFFAVFAHSLLYASLLEDPITWAALGICAGIAAARVAPSAPLRG